MSVKNQQTSVEPGSERAARSEPRPAAAPRPVTTRPCAEGGAEDRGPSSRPRRWIRALLRVPLFYKILIANAALILLSTALGGLLTARILLGAGDEQRVLILLVLAAVTASILVNAAILRVALRPLEGLEKTAARVAAGELDARAPTTVYTDRRLGGVIRTFNDMLDQLSVFRQRLRRIAIRALEAAEEERKRIARELHDDTAQALAGLLLRVKIARRADDAAERDEQLRALRKEITTATENVRRFARGLRPPALDMIGLVPALESHARTTAEASGIRVRVDAEEIEGLLRPEAELALYRIVQEALSNAVKHAQPRTVTISVWRDDSRVVTMVEDDGSGFDVDDVSRNERRGLGLFGMQERAAYIGGRLAIDSAPRSGTRVLLELPTKETGDDG